MNYGRRSGPRSAVGMPRLLGLIQRRAYVPILLLVPALVIGLGTFLPRPASRAAAIVDRAEVGGFIFEKSDDNLLGITDKKRGIRLEDDLAAASTELEPTEANLNSQMAEMRTLVKENLGWDLNSKADGDRIFQELHRLGQALHSIPNDYINKEENRALLALRDLADGLEGTSQCRGRCLPDEGQKNKVVSIAVFSIVNKIMAEFIDPGKFGGALAIVAVSLIATCITYIVLREGPLITGIPAPDLRRSAFMGSLSMLLLLKGFVNDARQMASMDSSTMREETKKAAEEIAKATPAQPPNESPSDYDMIHDEL